MDRARDRDRDRVRVLLQFDEVPCVPGFTSIALVCQGPAAKGARLDVARPDVRVRVRGGITSYGFTIHCL